VIRGLPLAGRPVGYPFRPEKTILGIYKEHAADAPARSVTGSSGNTLSSSRAYCADCKSEFMLSNCEYCYPVTVNDYRSGYLLTRESVPFTHSDFALRVFEIACEDFGLPRDIRIQRIEPGHPDENGRHERMQLNLKKESTKHAAFNFLLQQ